MPKHSLAPRFTPPLKWHGGKHYLARELVSLMPPHRHYVEPFAGGLAVLLAKAPRGISEVVNDLDGRLTSFWRVLQNRRTFTRFRRIVEAIPFSEAEWRAAHSVGHTTAISDRPVADAVAFFVECRQSLAGRQSCFAPLSRSRTRRGMNEQASAWLSAVDGLAAVHARLRRVVILNQPALDVLQSHDGPDTLFYLDPPYLPAARSPRQVYARDMMEEDHRHLLDVIQTVTGKVMLSGYPSPLYERHLRHWNRSTFDLPDNASGAAIKKRKTEVVWCNF